MVAGIFYVLAAMVVVAHASPHTDHANGFVLNMQFSTNSGKVNSWKSKVHLLKVQLLIEHFLMICCKKNWVPKWICQKNHFPDACACLPGHVLTIESHLDFMDGALLEHPAIRGDYFFNAATDSHPRGFFTKAEGKPLNTNY